MSCLGVANRPLVECISGSEMGRNAENAISEATAPRTSIVSVAEMVSKYRNSQSDVVADVGRKV